MTEPTLPPRKPRGFALMPRAKVQAIASAGGIAAHVSGTAHEWDRTEAIAAGRKGGAATHAKRKGGLGHTKAT
jgi:uncharacterized protein